LRRRVVIFIVLFFAEAIKDASTSPVIIVDVVNLLQQIFLTVMGAIMIVMKTSLVERERKKRKDEEDEEDEEER
jgi:hypothetical protein